MADAGFFRGTSSDQDGRFSDKEKKLLKQMKFEDTLERKINMDKINLDVIKPWITMRINEILGIEDDVVIEYIMSQLEEKTINPKIMQINITGFLNARRAREFMGELWMLLIEADESEDGIPQSLIEKKINEMRKEPRSTGNGDAEVVERTPQSEDWAKRYSSLSGGRYTGPTKEKEISDDRITRISPRGGTPPRQKKKSASREGTPPRRREDRERDRDKEREQRRQQRIEDEKKREEESKRREEERLKRRAEEKEREKRKEEERQKERERRRAEEERRERARREEERRRRRSRSRSRSPAKRRFTEGTSSSSKRRRSPSSSESEDDSRRKKKKKYSRRSSDEDSDYDRKSKKDKKAKKHKKEKKKKERKRSPTPSSSSSSSSLSDTE